MSEDTGKKNSKKETKEFPATTFAEDMSNEWSEDAIKAARDAFALTIASGDVHATIADFIRKKFDRDHERGWNCVVGRSFGAYVTHEIKTYMYFSVVPGTYILLWRS
jgi:dynein light chain LC8-type